MIIEIDKNYLNEFYNGNIMEAYQRGDCLEWTPERIKSAFNFGNGTEKDLERYIRLNKQFAIFKEV